MMPIVSAWFRERGLQSARNCELIVMSHVKCEGMTIMHAGTRLAAVGNDDRVVRQRPGLFLPHCGEPGTLEEE
jgi:hypothetical protein